MDTDYEKARAIRRFTMSRAGQVIAYTSWGEKFSYSQIREIPEKAIAEIGRVSLSVMTVQECDDLDFGKWSDEDPLRLIPIWLYPYLREGDEITSISGEKRIVSQGYEDRESQGYIDNDNRFGCLAWGIYPS